MSASQVISKRIFIGEEEERTGGLGFLPGDRYLEKDTDGYFLYDGSLWTQLNAGGGGSPGGDVTDVQYNDDGVLGGDSGLTWNKTAKALSVVGAKATASILVNTSGGGNQASVAFGNGTNTYVVGLAGDGAAGSLMVALGDDLTDEPVFKLDDNNDLYLGWRGSMLADHSLVLEAGGGAKLATSSLRHGLGEPNWYFYSAPHGFGIGKYPSFRFEIYEWQEEAGLLMTHGANTNLEDEYFYRATFSAENSANDEYEYGRIEWHIIDNADASEDGAYYLNIARGGSLVNAFAITNTEVVFNDAGGAINFRVEGDADAYLLVGDGTNDRIGIGTNSPSAKLHVVHDYSSSSFSPAFSVATTWSPTTTSGSVFPAAMQLVPKFDTTHTPASGFITSLRLFASVEDSGVLPIRNVDILSQNHGSGTLATVYDVLIRGAVNDGGGAITNYYALYISDQTAATNNYGIYQIGTDVVSYFQGKIGVGTNAPLYPLHVYGGLAVFQINNSSLQVMNRFYNANTTDGNGVVLNFDTDTTGTGATAQQFMAQIATEYTTHDHPTRTAKILFRPMANGSFMNPAMGISAGVVIGSPSGGYPGAGALSLDAHLNLDEMSSTPSSPASGASCNLYMKADKLIIQYNQSGTVRYKYLDLTGTGVTWQHSTTAP